MNLRNNSIPFLLFPILFIVSDSCKSSSGIAETKAEIKQIQTNPEGSGLAITVEVTPGSAINHPTLAIWVEDEQGNFVHNIYITESIAKGVFQHGSTSTGKWTAGAISRPAALPYWGHKWGTACNQNMPFPTPKNPLPDAVTGATPPAGFIVHSRLLNPSLRKFKVLMEVNQTWDWNEYWTNNKYPDDEEYKTSSQPALVYEAFMDPEHGVNTAEMKVIGHSHYSGKDGSLDPDLTTMTTALKIADKVIVRVF